MALRTSVFDLKPLNETINVTTHILFFFLVYLAIKNTSLDIFDIKRIFKFFIFGTLLNSIYVGYKLFFFSGIVMPQQRGFWRDPATFGVTLVIAIMYFLISLYDKTLSKKIRSIYGIIIIYLIFVLFASGSRTGLAIACILLSHYFIFISKISFVKKIISLSIFVIMIVSFINYIDLEFYGAILGRLTLSEISNAAGRTDLWNAGYNLFLDRPLIGVGLGQFVNFSKEYTHALFNVQNATVLKYSLSLHNIYLEMLIEYGFIGFLVFSLFNILLIQHTWRSYISSNRDIFLLFLLYCLAVILIQGMTGSMFIIQYYFLIIGLINISNRLVSQKNFI